MSRPAWINSRWRFSLRTLVILLLVMPPLLGLAWAVWPTVRAAWLEWTVPPPVSVLIWEEEEVVEDYSCFGSINPCPKIEAETEAEAEDERP